MQAMNTTRPLETEEFHNRYLYIRSVEHNLLKRLKMDKNFGESSRNRINLTN